MIRKIPVNRVYIILDTQRRPPLEFDEKGLDISGISRFQPSQTSWPATCNRIGTAASHYLMQEAIYMKIIDLSIDVAPDIPSDPPEGIPKIDYRTHEQTGPMAAGAFGCAVSDLPNGYGWATEFIQLSSHSGTHLDAPYHYYPTMNEGERAWTIDEVPLEWCYGNGVILDFSDRPDGYALTVEDFEAALKRLDYKLQPGDIVLIRSGAADRWGQPEYLEAGCGVGKEATRWLIAHGVHVVGTDAWSWDIPLPICAQAFKENQDPSTLWEAHRVGREQAYCHMEKMTNLESAPALGAKIVCFPVKLKAASAGWVRAVAIVED